ncbi:MAG TPA: hypothetical protein VFG23_00035 [Polyangia bacterium]|nr:hypothetical protein [Polyangia bacterium]
MFTIDPVPEVGTLAALKSAAEAHYRISVLEWSLGEQMAARPRSDKPPAKLRRQYWTAAYESIIHDIKNEVRDSGYVKPLEKLLGDVLAVNSE